MSESCKVCAFYADHAERTKENADAGQCHFNAPVARTDAEMRASWPVVTADEWCGRFEAQVA